MDGFICSQCGACCRWPGSVLLEEGDIEVAAAALQLDADAFIQRHTRLARNRRQLTLNENPDGACEFYDSSTGCRIYAARPRQCRDFPHTWTVDGCPACPKP